MTDNTNFEHDPTNRLRARGNSGGVDIEANTYPQTAQLAFNGVADVYTFRYDAFAGGDFIKLQLNGNPAPAGGASIGGLLFDTTFEPNLTLPLAGDYNRDDVVDAADYVVWRRTAGQSGYFLPADGNADNEIDTDDFDVWRLHFGETAGNGSGLQSGVPFGGARTRQHGFVADWRRDMPLSQPAKEKRPQPRRGRNIAIGCNCLLVPLTALEKRTQSSPAASKRSSWALVRHRTSARQCRPD